MIRTNEVDVGIFILRLTIAILMLFHGYGKIVHGTGFVEQMLLENNLPVYIAYGVYLGEIVAPIFLILGYKVRFSALLIVITMIIAVYLVHAKDILVLSKYGVPVLETVYFYIFCSIALIFTGSGRIAIDSK